MEPLAPYETELIGARIVDGRLAVDEGTCGRIQWLTQAVLQPLGVNAESGGWERLFLDPADGRCWVLNHPFNDLPGGGPPELRHAPGSPGELMARFVPVEDWKAEEGF
jgi:hypothetical protein